jgi:hypothetical protein
VQCACFKSLLITVSGCFKTSFFSGYGNASGPWHNPLKRKRMVSLFGILLLFSYGSLTIIEYVELLSVSDKLRLGMLRWGLLVNDMLEF